MKKLTVRLVKNFNPKAGCGSCGGKRSYISKYNLPRCAAKKDGEFVKIKDGEAV